MATLTGTSGADSLTGSHADDTFLVSQGGRDTVNGGDGQNEYVFGSTLTASDRIVGGAGRDTIHLSGDYLSPIVFGTQTLTSVEAIVLDGGHDYSLVLVDGDAVSDGHTLEVHFETAEGGDRLIVDASSRSQAGVFLELGMGDDRVTGSDLADHMSLGLGTDKAFSGAGADSIKIYANLDAKDRLDGGGDDDFLTLSNDYVAPLIITGKMVSNIEALLIEDGGSGRSTTIVLADSTVKAGQTLTVSTNIVDAAINLDGAAESKGTFKFTGGQTGDLLRGGAGDDTLDGSSGDDALTGGKGRDNLTGGLGADRFIYRSLTDSTVARSDRIEDLIAGDLVDLSEIDAKSTVAGNQAFKLVSVFHHKAGEALLFYDEDIGATYLSLDVDGDGEADAMITLAGDQTGFTGWVL